jgi:RecA/RadA recombinase
MPDIQRQKLGGVNHRLNTTVILTNKIRQEIGGMFGNPKITWSTETQKLFKDASDQVAKLQPLLMREVD